MAAPNRTIYLILGLLAQGPKSGYEIKRLVEKTISHFWRESYGQLYPTLARLRDQGLIEAIEAHRDGPTDRLRYAITAAGESMLQEWLSAPIEPDGVRNELALKLYFGQHTAVSVSQAHLITHRAQQQALLQQFLAEQPAIAARATAGDRAATHDLITLLLGIQVAQARIAWCDQALALLTTLAEAPAEHGLS
ncbi:MAG: PadR family transcriptional regulator [Roseiflexaceae bacterium]